MTQPKSGQIVWHDLFTSNRKSSMAFYGRVADWTYQVERATDFAWGGGEKDFVLALSGDEAGAGFAETPPNHENGWIPYIEVADVDAAVPRIVALGGDIVRQPFEVPGVGRNALSRDPLGALFGISLSRHSFPVPRRQFGPDLYIGNGHEFPADFYSDLFGWRDASSGDRQGAALLSPSGDPVAMRDIATWTSHHDAAWVPGIHVVSVAGSGEAAERIGARRAAVETDRPGDASMIIFHDPDGALFGMVTRAEIMS